MPRIRTAPFAIVALLATAGVAAAATLPDAATKGLASATQHSGQTVPVRPDANDNAQVPAALTADEARTTDVTLPDAASHGAAVSAVATDTSTTGKAHGAAVSAVAKTNAPSAGSGATGTHGSAVSAVATDHSTTGQAHGTAVSTVAMADHAPPTPPTH